MLTIIARSVASCAETTQRKRGCEIPSEMAASGMGVDGRTLKMVFSKLVDGLKATDIIDELFEKDLLILDEYTGILEACSQSSTREDSRNVNRRMLTAILRRPPGFVAKLVAILRKKDRSLANALEKGERNYKRFVCMLCDAYELRSRPCRSTGHYCSFILQPSLRRVVSISLTLLQISSSLKMSSPPVVE